MISVNEKTIPFVEGINIAAIRDEIKPNADVLVLNGFPASPDDVVKDNDAIVIITRGEMPSAEELDSVLSARHTPLVFDKVKRATVGIAGAGGLGSLCATILARTGIGKIIIADFDVVEPSNLNRQQYSVSDIGANKVDALEVQIKNIAPNVSVETHCVKLTKESIVEIFCDVDVMLECFDIPSAKVMAFEVARTTMKKTPWVLASGLAGYSSTNEMGVARIRGNVYVAGDQKNAAAPGVGLMAPRVAVCAGMQTNVALRLLLGEEEK